MQQLPEALKALGAYKSFILYDINTKVPISPRTFRPFPKDSGWQEDPAATVGFDEIAPHMAAFAGVYGVGFVLSDRDPFFCLDIDYCLEDGRTWSPLALSMLQMLQGCAVEVSRSGEGLHVFGTGTPPEHSCKNEGLGMELYHERRYIALTGTNAIGDAAFNVQHVLPTLVGQFFPKSLAEAKDWSEGPIEGYSSTEEDDELIAKMLKPSALNALWGSTSTVEALWCNDEATLASLYPSNTDTYNRSQADAGLAQHLIFWTGGDCDRTLRLMQGSGLVRDKWGRDDYLRRTIKRAYNLQTEFYSVRKKGPEGLAAIKGPSETQNAYAETCRAAILHSATPEQIQVLSEHRGPSFWIDNKGRTAEELVNAVTPIEAPAEANSTAGKPTRKSGYQYMTIDMQEQFFDGCTYVVDMHKIWRQRNGVFYGPDQFNAEFGGYEFQTDDTGKGKTKKAWAAFLDNQVLAWPRANSTVFEPSEEPGAIIEREGLRLLNTYIPVATPRQAGDASPFLEHVAKLLPDQRDQQIILSYMAACVQHKGHKFQWAPLIQGAPGNGKTLLTRVLKRAIGDRYTHMPRAKNIDGQFNGWMYGKLLVAVEDVYAEEFRRDVMETLKPIITNGDGLEIERKGHDQVTVNVCANFFFNANEKDAVTKSKDDRRICPFYTAQQSAADLLRDGMGGDYFAKLYGWLNDGGYAVVHDYLATYPIPAEFNPAVQAGGLAERAPVTTSTQEAVAASATPVDTAIMEAVGEERLGFRGGFISSNALADMLREERIKLPPQRFRKVLADLGYVPHPALPDGRACRTLATDAHRKPRLYVKLGHLSAQIPDGPTATDRYEQLQVVKAGESDGVMELFTQK